MLTRLCSLSAGLWVSVSGPPLRLIVINALRHLATVARPRGSDILLLRNERPLAYCVCAGHLPTSSPGLSLVGGCRDTPGPPEFSPNTRRHDLPRCPDRRGLWDPLPGMDSRVQPNGRPVTAFSTAELWKEKETRKWPSCPQCCSLFLSPARPYSFNPFKTIQKPNVPEGAIYLSGLSVTRELNWLAAGQLELFQGWKQMGRGNNCYCEW